MQSSEAKNIQFSSRGGNGCLMWIVAHQTIEQKDAYMFYKALNTDCCIPSGTNTNIWFSQWVWWLCAQSRTLLWEAFIHSAFLNTVLGGTAVPLNTLFSLMGVPLSLLTTPWNTYLYVFLKLKHPLALQGVSLLSQIWSCHLCTSFAQHRLSSLCLTLQMFTCLYLLLQGFPNILCVLLSRFFLCLCFIHTITVLVIFLKLAHL